MLRLLFAALLLLILVAGGCAEPRTPVVVQPVAIPEGASVAGSDAPDRAIWTVGQMEALPADTELVVVAHDPRQLLGLLELEELRARYPSVFASRAAETLEVFGADMTSPDALEALGVDTAAPMGFAWLNSQAEAGCFFGGLRDYEAFRGWMARAALLQKVELVESRHGEVLVVRADDEDEAALLVEPHRFMFVFVDRERYASGVVDRLARLSAEDSLARSPGFRRLSAHRLATGDLTGYVGVQAAMTHLFEELRGRRVPILSDIHAVAFGIGVGQGAHVTFDAVIDTKEGSLLRKLGAEGPTPHVFRARVDEPALVVGGHVASDQISALFDELLQIDGRPERDRRQLEELLGMDLHRQVAKTLTGELGLAVRSDVADTGGWSRERVTISGGLEDDGGDALVEQVKRTVGRSGQPVVEKLGAYLVVSDDTATLASLKRPSLPGRLPKGLTFDDFFAPGALALLRVDASFVAAELFDFHRKETAVSASPVSPPPSGSNPRRAELEQQIAELDQQVEEVIQRGAAIGDEAAEGAARRAGSTLLRLSEEGGALRIRGVQALQAPSVASILERALHDMAGREARLEKINAEVQALVAQRSALELKVEQLAPTTPPP